MITSVLNTKIQPPKALLLFYDAESKIFFDIFFLTFDIDFQILKIHTIKFILCIVDKPLLSNFRGYYEQRNKSSPQAP